MEDSRYTNRTTLTGKGPINIQGPKQKKEKRKINHTKKSPKKDQAQY